MSQLAATATLPAEKPKRRMRSFEAADDVDLMLVRAANDGISLVHLCNKALRELLTTKGYARKRD